MQTSWLGALDLESLSDALPCVTTGNQNNERKGPSVPVLRSDIAFRADGEREADENQTQHQPRDDEGNEQESKPSWAKKGKSNGRLIRRKRKQEVRARKGEKGVPKKAKNLSFGSKKAKAVAKDARKKAKAERSNRIENKRRQRKEMASLRTGIASLKC